VGKFVKSFAEMTKKDFQEAGGKAANLGELTQQGFNVPAGFCVTSDSLFYHIAQNQLQSRIDETVAGLDFEDFEGMEHQTGLIRGLISEAPVPPDLHQEISAALAALQSPEPCFVAVRSSVAVKDSTVSSFPGMMDTYHYLRSEPEIVEHIKKCWASLWTSRATFYRHHKGIDHRLGLIAPIVQKMVNPEMAGILFTANPISSDRGEMVIEANWGLGESVVSGKSMNDFFLLDHDTATEKSRKIAKKTVMVCFDEQKQVGRKEVAVAPEMMDATTLSREQVAQLGRVGLEIEAVFGFPQDIEWAFQKGELFILQSRNIRTLKS